MEWFFFDLFSFCFVLTFSIITIFFLYRNVFSDSNFGHWIKEKCYLIKNDVRLYEQYELLIYFPLFSSFINFYNDKRIKLLLEIIIEIFRFAISERMKLIILKLRNIIFMQKVNAASILESIT